MKVGLFFGSFNPIHIGHMALSNYIIEYSDLRQIWFVVSPHNPLKEKKSLLNDYARLELVELAIKDDPRFNICDIEFKLPQPSYTIDSLTYLREKYPSYEFAIIMGSDGLKTFQKWKNNDQIIKNHTRYVYPRFPDTMDFIKDHENVIVIEAPRIEISSTFIRNAIKLKKDVRHFLPERVFEEINKRGYYHKQ
jgi:nicotinate-nucleotide adenylyltransferase